MKKQFLCLGLITLFGVLHPLLGQTRIQYKPNKQAKKCCTKPGQTNPKFNYSARTTEFIRVSCGGNWKEFEYLIAEANLNQCLEYRPVCKDGVPVDIKIFKCDCISSSCIEIPTDLSPKRVRVADSPVHHELFQDYTDWRRRDLPVIQVKQFFNQDLVKQTQSLASKKDIPALQKMVTSQYEVMLKIPNANIMSPETYLQQLKPNLGTEVFEKLNKQDFLDQLRSKSKQ